MPLVINYTQLPLTPDDWIREFGLQPLKKVALSREQIALIQFDAKSNPMRYPCKHGVANYCGLCENNL